MKNYTEYEILDNLERRGFQLVHLEDFPAQRKIPFTDLFQFMIANPDGPTYKGVPVILSTAKIEEIDSLVNSAREAGQQNITGYFLETTGLVLQGHLDQRSRELIEASEQLWPPDAGEYIYCWGFESQAAIDAARERRTALARKWNVVEFNARINFEEMIKLYVGK
jgi:hypothetical protein